MRPPSETLQGWQSMGITPVTPDEIAQVRAAIRPTVPDDYITFLETYGFAEWDIDTPDSFAYRDAAGGQGVESITHLWPAKHLTRMSADQRSDAPDSLPLFYPDTHFPIGGTAGQDQILLEITGTPGRIWFWPEREDVWGTGINTDLCFVAESFTEFVEGLSLLETD